MNINKRGKVRNLTNEALIRLLKEINWCDKDLVREYDERRKDGRIQVQSKNPEVLKRVY